MRTTKEFIICIADDDKVDVMAIKRAIQKNGFICRIEHVPDGHVLMEYLNGKGKFAHIPLPNLLFLDINMPGKNGFEVLQDIEKSDQFKNIEVIILTGLLTDRVVETLRLLGLDIKVIGKDEFSFRCRPFIEKCMNGWAESIDTKSMSVYGNN